MTTTILAPSVHLVDVRKRHGAYVLRCFDCDWGFTVNNKGVAKSAAADHEADTA